jgi:plastocyanin
LLHVFKRLSYTLAVVVFEATLLVACSSAASNGTTTRSNNTTPHTASVSIPKGQQLFVPFILVVQPNTVVTWQNSDTVSHTIMTTWDQSTFLNPQAFSLVATAGQKASFTFTRPGVYDYFDNTHAKWIDGDQRVRANTGVPNFPLAMEGIVWVQGHIPDLPSSATNVIPKGKDDFATDFIAIRSGSRVTWHNGDTDKHSISLVYGWSAPINAADLGPYQINGTESAPPSGGSTTVTFTTPGLYYYYCSVHADVNTIWHRVQAHKDASEAPIPMEGFVLVVGN